MLLRKDYITKETAQKYWPSLISDDDNYKYIVEVSALKANGKVTFQQAHISASRELEKDGFIWRELFMDAPCLRYGYGKLMRKAQHELIYSQSRNGLLEKARACGLDDNHPYIVTLTNM